MPWYNSSLTLSIIWLIVLWSAPVRFKEAFNLLNENLAFSPDDLIISIDDAEKKDGGDGAIIVKLKNL